MAPLLFWIMCGSSCLFLAATILVSGEARAANRRWLSTERLRRDYEIALDREREFSSAHANNLIKARQRADQAEARLKSVLEAGTAMVAVMAAAAQDHKPS